eukprot:Mycagemm_TRINITY_DN10330_c1_g10::TRINITY_DN10330_c1_g10_i1::g.1143::m.1143 type:complete len:104 gc:universal TRINITY_DN10330_c1_g10_i1:645-334(-)
MGVTRRWILGALVRFFFLVSPSLTGSSRRMTYLRTSSFLPRSKSLRTFEARLGPRRRGMFLSVSPGIASSPFFTTTRLRTEISLLTTQPRTDLRLRSPLRRGL